ncbi:hypothetical protein [Porphyromonas pasteri]|uniref:Lipoprotein n=1 Tax=Porphyromonas pasteri TaxID=1583331 RepID=A0ABQ2H6G7_9PORP|nr:hypothetical protein [Porphyromonas pasteri]GGM52620.1 hypothetical protein GCM10007088_09170 [Porphyromonas pasteri]
MYITILQPRLLTLALLIGLYGCASHHRTTHESTTESHTTSDLQRTLHTTHQEHALDTLTLDLTEVVQLLPPSDDTTVSSKAKGAGWIAHYHLRQIGRHQATTTGALREVNSLRSTTRTIDKGITSHKVPASPLRPFALGVTLPLLLGAVYLTYKRTKR